MKEESEDPSALKRISAKSVSTPGVTRLSHPAARTLPSGCTATAVQPEAARNHVISPLRPKDGSPVPSELKRSSAKPSRPRDHPPTTIFPSGCKATARPNESPPTKIDVF